MADRAVVCEPVLFAAGDARPFDWRCETARLDRLTVTVKGANMRESGSAVCLS